VYDRKKLHIYTGEMTDKAVIEWVDEKFFGVVKK
jgi:hypothetical protein